MTFRPWQSMPVAALWLCCVVHHPAAADSADVHRECELGITLALQARLAAADSVFTSLLAHSPGDARALTNLGNIRLLRGEREVALKFYESASRADTADAGILLDRGITLYLIGQDSLARASVLEAVAAVGGREQALALIGISGREITRDEENRAADMSAAVQFPTKHKGPGQRTSLTRNEVLALTREPAGTEDQPAAADSTRKPAPRRLRTRPSPRLATSTLVAHGNPGSGAADRHSAAALYWKR